MVLKLLSGAAVLAVLAGLNIASAQTTNDFGAPRELPPASFTGQQYVDSRGCVFLRAGFGGRVNWVPRVNASRAPLCGYPPTFGNNQVVIVDPPRAEPAPVARAPEPRAVPAERPPLDTVASTTTAPRIRAIQTPSRVAPPSYVPPPVAVARPQPQVPRTQPAQRVSTTAGSGKIGCYRDVPVAERFSLQNGGSVVLCTRGDGDLAHARAPRLVEGGAAVAPSGYLVGPDPAAGLRAGQDMRRAMPPVDQPVVPKGYKKAFDDDRLNPNRGIGTREGWAQQDQIWTRDVPARLVANEESTRGKVRVLPKVHASSKAVPSAAPVGEGGRAYVQVGTFGEPANAEGAFATLSRLGLPVARGEAARNGKALQIVMAGPFASNAEAQAALAAARSAGFSDAFIR
ncbi:SPOR domain-containing protein [Pseudorhodobacter sp. MZDSW-24AT]|uniref:SPOR domain-containing protein n=1 Tax=Pseudorhodobacter sp. MZDSW-24AT TaxID=2052957 RepID=UPI0012FDE6A3|nr:SPOR domain-containing protein [Pseudorhodobacter sp. MZDSW-24AT]